VCLLPVQRREVGLEGVRVAGVVRSVGLCVAGRDPAEPAEPLEGPFDLLAVEFLSDAAFADV
jgi:hypothetical protein